MHRKFDRSAKMVLLILSILQFHHVILIYTDTFHNLWPIIITYFGPKIMEGIFMRKLYNYN